MAKAEQPSAKDVRAAIETYLQQTRLDLLIMRWGYLESTRRVWGEKVRAHLGDKATARVEAPFLYEGCEYGFFEREDGWGYRPLKDGCCISRVWDDLTSADARLVRDTVNGLVNRSQRGMGLGDTSEEALVDEYDTIGEECLDATTGVLKKLRDEAHVDAAGRAKLLRNTGAFQARPPEAPRLRGYPDLVSWLHEWVREHCEYLTALSNALAEAGGPLRRKRRRGGQQKYSVKDDNRLYEKWQEAKGKGGLTRAEFARENGKTKEQLIKLLARVRYRKRAGTD